MGSPGVGPPKRSGSQHRADETMSQTKLSRYERCRKDSDNELRPSEKDIAEENRVGTKGERPHLNPDEKAVLDYVERKQHLAKEELQHQSELPETHLDDILKSLEDRGLIIVQQGYTIIQIESQQGEMSK